MCGNYRMRMGDKKFIPPSLRRTKQSPSLGSCLKRSSFDWHDSFTTVKEISWWTVGGGNPEILHLSFSLCSSTTFRSSDKRHDYLRHNTNLLPVSQYLRGLKFLRAFRSSACSLDPRVFNGSSLDWERSD